MDGTGSSSSRRPRADQIGPYQVEGELARGGMGVVFRARAADGAPIALKLLRVEDARTRQRFLREMRVLTRLRHPHLVRILDAGEDQGRAWLAMELVEGRGLEERLRREGALEPRQAVELARALCSAVSHAHRLGVLHRDLKPANVLLRPDGTPLLLDFGLAKDLGSGSALSLSGVLMGSPGYWAPEQAAGDLGRLGAPTDVYGLGAILYAALTGRPPLQGATLQEALDATLHVTPAAPSQVRPGPDSRLDEIVLRALEKDPARRWPTPEALEAALAGWRARSRRPGLRAALAALAALSGLAAALALAGRAIAPPPPPAPRPERPDAARTTSATPDGWLLREARARYAAGQPRAAEALCTRLLERDPLEREALFLRARARAGQQEWAGVLADCDRLLELDPDHAKGHFHRGWALASLRRHEQAVEAYRRAAELGDPFARQNVAVYLRTLGRLEEALLEARRAQEVLSGSPRPWILEARILGAQGDRPGAVAALHSAIVLAHTDDALLDDAARLARELDDANTLRAAGERQIARQPGSGIGYLNRGLALRMQGEHEAAVADYRRAVALGPTRFTPWFSLGNALCTLGRTPEALTAYDAALGRLSPRSPNAGEVYARRGLLLLEQGDLARARADLTAAGALLRPGSKLGEEVRARLASLER